MATNKPEPKRNKYDLLESKVSNNSLKTFVSVIFLSGGSIKFGICLWVPTLVTIIPMKIKIAATNPYSDQA